ncbi:MAG: hypothetical protein R2764_16410 [Bacteroidales bacterium]
MLRLKNSNNWRTVNEGNCGFEYKEKNSLYTDDEKTELKGEFVLNSKQIVNGLHSVETEIKIFKKPGFPNIQYP